MNRLDAPARISSAIEDILRTARVHSNDIALIERGGRQITYGEFARQVETVSSRLERAGMKPGDRVLFSVRPGIAAIVLILATARAGGVVVAADPGMGRELFRARMAMARVSWGMAESILFVASAPPLRQLLRARGLELADLGDLALRFIRVGPWLPGVPRAIPFGELLRPVVELTCSAEDRSPDAPLFIVFTSGTTSAPRAVVHTDASLGAMLDMMSGQLGMKHGDVVYTDQLHGLLPALLAGATSIIPSRRRTPRGTVRDLRHYRATHHFAVPYELQRVVDHCMSRGDLLPDTLRTIVVGAAPAPASFLHRLRLVISPGTEVWSAYAMTEMLPVCMVSLDEKLQFAGSGDLVGKPVAGVSVCLAEDGELVVAGPNLCESYLGSPTLHELATGDLAYIDPLGRVVLTGRKKDMIIRGEHNIYPALYEPTVLSIEGVRECAFIGVRDEDAADERVVLVVDPSAGTNRTRLMQRIQEELRDGDRRIDSTAQPDHILFMQLSVSGRSSKLDRSALRRRVERVLS